MTITLYHCQGARSLRPLWTLEEMGLDYELVKMPFPPRLLHEGYTGINPIGTVPFFRDGTVEMTESAGIAQYLAEMYGPDPTGLKPGDADYGAYMNWIHRSDATLTFPQTIVLRYTQFEPEERRVQQVADDYTQWFFSRLRSVENALEGKDYLCADRFTVADICVGYALCLADSLNLRKGFKANTEAYYARLCERPAFKRAVAL